MFILTSKFSILSGLMFTDNTFLVYDASAGSGKTYMLVRNYLAVLLGNPGEESFKNILAITFTNKAAAEMKVRILDRLHDLSSPVPKDVNLQNDLTEILKIDKKELAVKAEKILKKLLHNYRDFSVSTIDAFTVKVVRTFAPDLRLSYRFGIELDTDMLYQKAIELLYAELESQPELTQFLVAFALDELDENRQWDISDKLLKAAQKLGYENYRAQLEKFMTKDLSDFTGLTQILKERKKITTEAISQKAEEVLRHIAEAGLEESDFTKSTVPNFFKKIVKDPKTAINFSAVWIRDLNQAKLYNQTLQEDKQLIIDQMRPFLSDSLQALRQLRATQILTDKVDKSLKPLAVLNRLKYWFDKIKEENRLLPLFEANQLIWEEVRNQEVPFIYERLGQKYRYYFIDEFQDTSRRQWENLVPLTAHTLSVESGSRLPGLLMLVGDAKQSIYSWRGGDPHQFINICRGQSPFPITVTYEILEKNYRSRKEIVDFNNEFFTSAAVFLNTPYKEIYLESCTQKPSREAGGYVRVEFIEAGNKEQKDETYPVKVLEIINEVTDLGYAWSDVCILVRKNESAKTLATFLTENQIPVISAESLLLASHSDVNFVADWLILFQHPDDREAHFRVIDQLAEKMAVSPDKRHGFIQTHLQQNADNSWNALGKGSLSFADAAGLDLYEAAEAIIAHFRLCPESHPYLSAWMDYLHDYTLKNSAYALGFLEVWKEQKQTWSLAESSGNEAVQIMTIHKSKGLQFPVVIYPYADDSLYNATKTTDWLPIDSSEWGGFDQVELNYTNEMLALSEDWTARAEQLKNTSYFEAYNHIYVAQTRAAEQLYILSASKNSKEDIPKSQAELYSLFLNNYPNNCVTDFRYQWGQQQLYHKTDKESKQTLADAWAYRNEKISVYAVASQAALLWGSQQEAAVEKGKLLHSILADIYSDKDLELAVNKAIDEGILPENEKSATELALKNVVQHPALAEYYSSENQIFNERTLLFNGNFYRPDRLVINEKNAVIIDYKTGHSSPSYENQLREYGKVMQRTGYQVKEAFLVYLREEIEVVSINI